MKFILCTAAVTMTAALAATSGCAFGQGSSATQPAAPSTTATSAQVLPIANVGGGYADAGLRGEYFPNATLTGKPTFTRHDVRLDFAWGARNAGGSIAEPYRSFPADNFSIRWTGRLLPRFSEAYTITAQADDGIRVFLKSPDKTTWTTIIDNWTTGGKIIARSAKINLKAGIAYDIKVEYRDLTGAGVARLLWSSPNTPREIIDAASGIATNAYSEGFTDAMKTGRDEWKKIDSNDNAKRDANGWPLEDAWSMIWEGRSGNEGTYALQFKGQADVRISDGEVADKKYDAATNTTTAKLQVKPGFQNFVIYFTNTQRDANSPKNSGVTQVRMLMPTAVGSTTPYPATSLFVPAYTNTFKRYTALRFMAGTNWNNSVAWSDVTSPDYSTQRYTRPGESGFETNGMAWEYRVMLCNQVGKDLYINIPETANDDYITKLAQLIKYGSNGRTPYTAPQTKPVYPPLNSNLKVFVEYTNEVWNYGFQAWRQNYDAAQEAVKNGTPEGKALTFDGNNDGNVLWNRRHVYQTVRASNLFRKVWGDSAMGNRVRVLHFWQYDNAGWPPTATVQMQFLDNYFNNGDGKQNVKDPHPPSYYIWGAGGATYYKSQNEEGVTDLIKLRDFETPVVKDTATPANTGWTFTGTAGMAHNGSSLGGPDNPQPGEWDADKTPNLQFAYVQGKGSISAKVTFPANQVSDLYSIQYRAVQRRKKGAAKSDQQTFDVYLDDQKISKPTGWEGFNRPADDWRKYEGIMFNAKAGSTHTLKIVGAGEADQAIFIDDFAITSVDALYAQDIPSNDNKKTLADYQQRLDVMGNWAHIFGLKHVAYEGGWALGGDAGGTEIQNWAKYNDPRTKDAHLRAINAMYKAGGVMNTFGTYGQYSSWAKADKEPLNLAIDESNRKLPVAPQGIAVPGDLTVENRLVQWGDKNQDTGAGGKVGSNTFLTWEIIVPKTGSYTFNTTPTGTGTAQLLVNNLPVATAAAGKALTGTTKLTAGLHNVRIKTTDGSLTVTSVTVKTAP